MLSISSTIRRGESMTSALAINSRLSAARPARFSPSVSSSVSKDCNREVNAAPRSQIFLEPMSRKVGSWERRSASLTSSYPAQRLYIDCRKRSASGNWVFFPRGSARCRSMSSPKPNRSSNSRTKSKPPSEVTRAPWKSTRKELLNES